MTTRDHIAGLREAAYMCATYSERKWHEYKTGNGPGRANPVWEGQSDGAEECAVEIRARADELERELNTAGQTTDLPLRTSGVESPLCVSRSDPAVPALNTAAQVPAQPQSGAPSPVQHPEPAPAVPTESAPQQELESGEHNAVNDDGQVSAVESPSELRLSPETPFAVVADMPNEPSAIKELRYGEVLSPAGVLAVTHYADALRAYAIAQRDRAEKAEAEAEANREDAERWKLIRTKIRPYASTKQERDAMNLAELASRCEAAGHDERLSTGALYREAAHILRLLADAEKEAGVMVEEVEQVKRGVVNLFCFEVDEMLAVCNAALAGIAARAELASLKAAP